MDQSDQMREPDAGNYAEVQSILEHFLLELYLECKGLTLHSLNSLPETQAKKLRTEASIYASSKLAEVEARADLVRRLTHPNPSI